MHQRFKNEVSWSRLQKLEPEQDKQTDRHPHTHTGTQTWPRILPQPQLRVVIS